MENQLLITKLIPPVIRPNIVPRTRLIDQMEKGLESKLVLITAPAGYGKTTLLCEWLARRGVSEEPIAWINLSIGDDDPQRFWRYVTFSLANTGAPVGDVPTDLCSLPCCTDGCPIITTLINQIYTHSRPILMILDDFQVIENEKILRDLDFVLENAPINLHLMISSRQEPNIRYARLHARGQLSHISTPALRFNPDETELFLNQTMGLNLSKEDALILSERTAGWITGLQIAGLSLKRCTDTQTFIATFAGSHEIILHYLEEEVVSKLPVAVQEFLIQTSILDRLCEPLCRAVTQMGNCQQVLDRLIKAELFLVSLDEQKYWSKYHQLFAEVLQQRLHRDHPTLVHILHSRASDWYKEAGYLEEAIDHSVAAGDYDRAIDLIEGYTNGKLMINEANKVFTWLNQIPNQIVNKSLRAMLITTWANLSIASLPAIFSTPSMISVAEHDINPAQKLSTPPEHYQNQIDIIQAAQAFFCGDFLNGIQLSLKSLHHLGEYEQNLKSILLMILGACYKHHCDVDEAIKTFAEVKILHGNISLSIYAASELASLQSICGNFYQAVRICKQTLDLVENEGYKNLSVVGLIYLVLGELQIEWNNIERAEQHILQGVKYLFQGQNIEFLSKGYIVLSKLRVAQGDVQGAFEFVNRAVQISGNCTIPWLQSQVLLAQAGVALLQKRYRTLKIIEEKITENIKGKQFRVCIEEQIVLSRLAIFHKEEKEAIPTLEQLEIFTEHAGLKLYQIEILVLRALALQSIRKPIEASATLLKAAGKAFHEDIIHVFIKEGRPMVQLLIDSIERLRQTPDSGDDHLDLMIFLEKLLTLLLKRRSSSSTSISILTKRELEILGLLATGKTAPDIANILFLSTATIRTHIHNLYHKLGIHNRAEAFEKAKELDVI